MGEMKNLFRPEFLNRVDDIIVFHKLTSADIREIAVRLLNSLKKRLADLSITVTFTDAAIDAVAKAGFDPVYGARPLKRAIQSKIEDALSECMLDGTVKAGKTVVCDYRDDKFTFDTDGDSGSNAESKPEKEEK